MNMKPRPHGGMRFIVLGGLALVLSSALAMAALAQSTVKPSNTSPPTISGTPSQGSTLTANPGNWNGTPAPTFQYQWQRCDKDGGSCAAISGATQQTYTLAAVDNGNTLRVHVKATNSAGSASRTTVPTAVITASSTPAPAASGCSSGSGTVAVSGLSAPTRLQIAGFNPTPGVLPGGFRSFSVAVHVTDTCGQSVSGANVFATAVPYNQVTVPAQAQTNGNGWVRMTFYRRVGFPASRSQRLMVMFIRASKPGESILSGVSTNRLVSFPVNLNGV